MKKYLIVLLIFICSFWFLWISKAVDMLKLKSLVNIIVSNKKWNKVKLNELKQNINVAKKIAIEKTKNLPDTHKWKKNLLEILDYFLVRVEKDIPNDNNNENTNNSLVKNKSIIFSLTSIFENSSTELNYWYIENIGDGRWYTFGFAGFTSWTYDGTMFLKKYHIIDPNNKLVKYIKAFEAIDAGPHTNWLSNDLTWLSNFPNDFKSLASDKLFIKAQHELVDELYWNPSQKKAQELWLKFALSKWQMYDSFINHWKSWAIKIITKTNNDLQWTPVTIDEKKWLKKYLENRYDTLAADTTWSEALDRVEVYQKILKENNVNFTKLPFNVTCYWDNFTIN